MTLLQTIHAAIKRNGGRQVMARLIMVENPEYFHAGFEATKAEDWLKKRGVFNGVLPENFVQPPTQNRYSRAEIGLIKQLHNEPGKLAALLKRDPSRKIRELQNAGVIEKVQTKGIRWLPEEDDYIRANGHYTVINEMIPELHKLNPVVTRTWNAVAARKSVLKVKLDVKYKLPKLSTSW